MIYIKGMEMPKSCGDCKAFVCYRQWAGDAGDCFCGITKNDAKAKEKNADCPLVPVPSHGRLIDADALRQSIRESVDECQKWADEVESGEMYARVSQSLGTFVECSLRVKAAPTIIPASEEGE